MDTLQLVSGEKVRVYTLKKGIKDTVMYDEKGVVARFGFGPELLPDYKGLRGDPSDNIPGIRGIGEKTAEILISNFGSLVYKALEKGHKEKLIDAGIKQRIITLLEEGKEEAFFSRLLAQIRTDAPITFILPEKIWRETIDVEEAVSFLRELGFRSLVPRLESELGVKKTQEALFEEKEEVDEEMLKEAQVMAWLLDSDQTNPSLEEVLDVAKRPTLAEAHTVLEERIQQENLSRVYEEIEKPLIPIVDEMCKRGVELDTAYLKKLSDAYHKDLNVIQADIWKLAGEEFNIGSPKQLREILFEKLELTSSSRIKKTSTGVQSTAESELEKMQDAHPMIPKILEYRELQKLLSTYIDPLPRMVDEKSRLHTTFIQTGTTTGRISSQSPNLQNIPIRSDLGAPIRNAFVASKGMLLVALDYSQIELRIAAMLSGDEKLTETFKEERDIHARVASEIFDVPEDKVSRAQRIAAKTINFGILYGMGVNALKTNLGGDTTRDQATKYLEEYFESFTKLRDYMEETKRFAKKHGYTETYFGRRRRFEAIRSRIPHLRAQAERMAINAPIQGTQADIIKKAMSEVDVFLKNTIDRGGLVLQIHDELVYELPEERARECAFEIKKIMQEVIPSSESRGIVFRADARVGKAWGDMEPITN
jgi:DNA polymerase-1